MRTKYSKLLMALALVSCMPIAPHPAFAQVDKIAAIKTLPIAEMCGKDGALGHKFGSNSMPASTSFTRGMANTPLEARFAPFEWSGISTSKYSNKMYEALLEADFGSAAQAEKAIQDIAALYAAQGWTPVIGRDQSEAIIAKGKEPSDLIPPVGYIDLYLDAADAKTGNGVRVSLQPFGRSDGSVTLTCQDSEFLAQHLDEALGEYPTELGRPKPPSAKQAVSVTKPADCADPAQRGALIASFKNSDWMPETQYTDEEHYQESLAAWKSTILMASGKISRETLAGQQLNQVVDSGSVDALNKNIDTFGALMPQIEALEKLEKSGDAVGFCEGIKSLKIKLADFAKAAASNNKNPWASFHTFLDAEAKRLGVSFPE